MRPLLSFIFAMMALSGTLLARSALRGDEH